jgi:hypothetical protein
MAIATSNVLIGEWLEVYECEWRKYVACLLHYRIIVAAQSEAWTVFARSKIGIMGLNPAWGMVISVRLFCHVSRYVPCDRLIPRPRAPTDCVIKKLKKRPWSNKGLQGHRWIASYVFWNGATSSTRKGVWLMLVTSPLLMTDPAGPHSHSHSPLHCLTSVSQSNCCWPLPVWEPPTVRQPNSLLRSQPYRRPDSFGGTVIQTATLLQSQSNRQANSLVEQTPCSKCRQCL